MRRPAPVNGELRFLPSFFATSSPTNGRRVTVSLYNVFPSQKGFGKAVPCVRCLAKRQCLGFGRSRALRFPPLAPLPSALWVSRIRPGASWGPSFPSRCCYLCGGLEDQDANRSHPDAAVCGCCYARPNLFHSSFHQNTFCYGPLFPIPSCRLAYAAALSAAWLLRSGSYTSPVTSKRCSSTANFRATATIARFLAFFPPRAANRNPHRRTSL